MGQEWPRARSSWEGPGDAGAQDGEAAAARLSSRWRPMLSARGASCSASPRPLCAAAMRGRGLCAEQPCGEAGRVTDRTSGPLSSLEVRQLLQAKADMEKELEEVRRGEEARRTREAALR